MSCLTVSMPVIALLNIKWVQLIIEFVSFIMLNNGQVNDKEGRMPVTVVFLVHCTILTSMRRRNI